MPVYYLQVDQGRRGEEHDLRISIQVYEAALPRRPSPARYPRISPIFPVLPTFSLPDFTGESYIGFYSFDSPFPTIGQIASRISEPLQNQLLFSHGLASLILVTTSKNDLDAPREIAQETCRGWEMWSLSDGTLVGEPEYWLREPESVPAAPVKLEEYSGLPNDIMILLNELEHCIDAGLSRSLRYAPRYIPTFLHLILTVNTLVKELRYLILREGELPASLTSDFGDLLLRDSAARQRRLNQRIDQLVQLNSSLSYVISQAFSGAIPILEHESQVRTYSLLGIGSAFSALFNLASFVQGVFEKHPIHEIVRDRYSDVQSVNIFTTLRDFDRDQWVRRNASVDHHLARVSETRARPKLVLFSGRLGFKESEFSVAAALQALAASDSSRWSLMTFTHELMHAHVRGILGVLFRDEEGRSPEAVFAAHYEDLRSFFFPPPTDKPREDPPVLTTSLRCIVLNYCIQKRAFARYAQMLEEEGRSTSEAMRSNQKKIVLPQPARLWRWWQDDHRDINEILTHVLDFYYFYDGQEALYLGLLWESWATVPAVLSEIDHYVFRSLVSIGTKRTGNIPSKFRYSRRILEEQLTVILSRREDTPVVQAAVDLLRNNGKMRILQLRFYPAIYLAEAAVAFFRSRAIHSALVADDPNVRKEDGEYVYALENLQFPGYGVVSPVGLLADRLRRSLASGGPGLTGEVEFIEERKRSAWLLLALAGTG